MLHFSFPFKVGVNKFQEHSLILVCHCKQWDCDVRTKRVQQQLSTLIQFMVHQQSAVVWPEKSQQETHTHTGKSWQESDNIAAECDWITDWLRQRRLAQGCFLGGTVMWQQCALSIQNITSWYWVIAPVALCTSPLSQLTNAFTTFLLHFLFFAFW